MKVEKYTKVIVKNNSIFTDNLFTYKIPDFLADNLQIGHRVLVPFGKGNKPIEAYVFVITDEAEDNINFKEIFDILDEHPIFKEEDINLIKWMKNRYLCTYMDCISFDKILCFKRLNNDVGKYKSPVVISIYSSFAK